ncbi:MAG: hypothetical protein ABMA64_05560 [Myxococcota bacterium]
MRQLWWAVVAGCAPVGPSLETQTDGGTWTVTVAEAPVEAGTTKLELAIAPTTGVLRELLASMPDMGHTSEADIEGRGEGVFVATVAFTMAGWWVVDGEVAADGTTEGFRLEFEVP